LKLGVQATSDRISAQSSYTMTYTPSVARTDIVESMRTGHIYGATDIIIGDFQALDAQQRTYMMGDVLAVTAPVKFRVMIAGTHQPTKVEIVKDGKLVRTVQPESGRAQFSYVHTAAAKGECCYYVRAIQRDRDLAWSRPISVRYAGP
jgi:hypothetical protein